MGQDTRLDSRAAASASANCSVQSYTKFASKYMTMIREEKSKRENGIEIEGGGDKEQSINRLE